MAPFFSIPFFFSLALREEAADRLAGLPVADVDDAVARVQLGTGAGGKRCSRGCGGWRRSSRRSAARTGARRPFCRSPPRFPGCGSCSSAGSPACGPSRRGWRCTAPSPADAAAPAGRAGGAGGAAFPAGRFCPRTGAGSDGRCRRRGCRHRSAPSPPRPSCRPADAARGAPSPARRYTPARAWSGRRASPPPAAPPRRSARRARRLRACNV